VLKGFIQPRDHPVKPDCKPLDVIASLWRRQPLAEVVDGLILTNPN
jgi:hypothetical protein